MMSQLFVCNMASQSFCALTWPMFQPVLTQIDSIVCYSTSSFEKIYFFVQLGLQPAVVVMWLLATYCRLCSCHCCCLVVRPWGCSPAKFSLALFNSIPSYQKIILGQAQAQAAAVCACLGWPCCHCWLHQHKLISHNANAPQYHKHSKDLLTSSPAVGCQHSPVNCMQCYVPLCATNAARVQPAQHE